MSIPDPFPHSSDPVLHRIPDSCAILPHVPFNRKCDLHPFSTPLINPEIPTP